MRACVIGLGAMGVAAARVLAERGHEVLAVDREHVGHDRGSSAGNVRIFRLSHRRPEHVRLARRALLHWRELERRDGASLLRATGLLEIGGPHDAVVAAMRAEHGTIVELDGGDLARHFPGLQPRGGLPARWTPAAGVLAARDCLLVQADLAARAGAEIATEEPALAIEPRGDEAVVRTAFRQVEVDVVVVAAGPWLNDLLQPIGLAQPLEPALGQASFFRGDGWERRPCLIEWDRDGSELAYGLPVAGTGYKIGMGPGATWSPDDDDRRPDQLEAAATGRYVGERLVGLDPRAVRSERCPWTTTPDGEFIIDRRGPVVIAGGCNGHGFKFSPVIGELVADLAEGGAAHPCFRLDRPTPVRATRVAG